MSEAREPFKIVIEPDAFGRRASVVIYPRAVDRPSRAFPSIDLAQTFAEQMAAIEGWPIIDQTSGE